MSVEVVIVLLVIAALIGAGVVYLTAAMPARVRATLAEGRIANMEAEIQNERGVRETLAIEKATAATLADRVPQLECTISDLRAQLECATTMAAETRANLDTERKTYAARVQELEKMGAEIERNFAVLASEALGKNSENFLKLMSERSEKHKAAAEKDLEDRQKAIESLVKPVSESLSKFEHEVGELEKARVGAYCAITEQVKNLADGQVGLRTETSRLVQALRRPKTRGRWGEYQLQNVLEMAGMTEHVDFIEERTIEGDGGRLRPDVIVRLPGGKSVVIDAKTPLEAYLAALDTNDEETRERQMVDHARQVRDHVRTLASREYWKALPVTPDFVV